MRKRLAAFVLAGSIIAITVVPASAHEGHESCAGGAVESVPVVLPGAPTPGPAFGPFAKSLATQGLADEAVALIHAGFCEPHDPGE